MEIYNDHALIEINPYGLWQESERYNIIKTKKLYDDNSDGSCDKFFIYHAELISYGLKLERPGNAAYMDGNDTALLSPRFKFRKIGFSSFWHVTKFYDNQWK